ncbi:MAG: ABC transporter ATP-binding protein [Pseudomonadota bacterium]
MENKHSMISLVDAVREFSTDTITTSALDHVSLDVRPGEFVAIAGPSGGGKTTLLSILGLLDPIDSGRYVLDGQDTANLNATQRAHIRNRKIGFVFQSFNLLGDLTVHENVALPLAYRGMSEKIRNLRVREAIERVGMEHRKNHYPSQLSGGQQQRVAVARAIAGDPALLLADEPTGNLDIDSGEEVLELLSQLNETGSTIVIVTHDPACARRAERVEYLLDGRLVESAEVRPELVRRGFVSQTASGSVAQESLSAVRPTS